MLTRHKQRPGYTLLELLVILAILGAVTVKAMPKVAGVLIKTRATQCLENRARTESAEERYRLEHNSLPASSLNDLKLSGYIDRIPKCSAGGSYIWISTVTPAVIGCSMHYWPYPVSPASAALYASAFDDMSGLTVLSGRWTSASGSLKNTASTESRVYFGTSTWKDYSLTTQATLASGSGYGIYYRADGKANISGYAFQYDPGWGAFIVRKVTNGRESAPIQAVRLAAGYPVYSTPHQITIEVVGGVQKIYVDQQLIMNFSDTTFTQGGAGFRTWDSTRATFDSVTVNPV